MKLIYIASPFTAKSKTLEKHRKDDVTRIAALLTKKYGLAMFLPITQSYAMMQYVPDLGGKFHQWEEIDLYIIKEKADEVWVITLEGWKESVGVQAEIACARQYTKPLYFINPSTLKKTRDLVQKVRLRKIYE